MLTIIIFIILLKIFQTNLNSSPRGGGVFTRTRKTADQRPLLRQLFHVWFLSFASRDAWWTSARLMMMVEL